MIHFGSESWPVWSDPTHELLLVKLLKKLMLVLTERCQNTKCIAVCCVWCCRAADQSGGHVVPCPLEQWKKVAWSDASRCPLHHMDGHRRRLPGEHMAPRCTMGRGQAGRGSAEL